VTVGSLPAGAVLWRENEKTVAGRSGDHSAFAGL